MDKRRVAVGVVLVLLLGVVGVGVAGGGLVLATSCSGESAPPPPPSTGHGTEGEEPEKPPDQPIINPGAITKPGVPPVAFKSDQCSAMTDGGPVIDGCMTAEVRCGDVITGHTAGGVQKLDTRFYEKFFCTPGTTNHDAGEERIYKLVVTEPQTRVLAYLDSPCASLDLAAFRNSDGSATCPNPDGAIPRCEMAIKKEQRKFVDIRDNDPTTYWIVIEGQKAADSGPFALSIQCEKW